MKEKILNVKSAVYIGRYKMSVQFENGELRIADFGDIPHSDLGVYSDLKNEEYFKQKYSIEGGTLEIWPRSETTAEGITS